MTFANVRRKNITKSYFCKQNARKWGKVDKKMRPVCTKKQETRESLLLMMIGMKVLLDYLSLSVVAFAVADDDELAVLDAL